GEEEDINPTRPQACDRRNDVITEAALDYIELDLLESSLNVQKEQRELANKFEDVVNQRMQAGIDAPLELTRAKLAGARTRMQMTETQGAIDQVRLKLSKLYG